MKAITTEIESKIDQLFGVLDIDIQYMTNTLSGLDELRALVIKRDEDSLHKLLSNIQSKANRYKENELSRQSIREELATALGCRLDQMTLTNLETDLSGERKDGAKKRRIKLQILAGELKKEHIATMMLLADCARFNNSLLTGILQFGRTGTTTYSQSGSAERETKSAFVNLQL